MKVIQRLVKFLSEDLWTVDIASLSSVRRSFLHMLRVIALVFRGFKEDQCPLHASALTFSAVMAMVPTLIIAFSFAKGFGMHAAQDYVLGFFEEQPPAIERPAAPEEPSPVTAAPAPERADVSETTAEFDEEFELEIPEEMLVLSPKLPAALRAPALQILKTVEEASAAKLGTVSTIIFLWIVIKMLSKVEESFNQVWGVKTSRSMMDKIRNYVFVLAVAPMLLILGTAAIPVLMAVQKALAWMGPLLGLAFKLIPVLIMSLAFAVVYVFLPNTRVKMKPALAGAFCSALLVVMLQVLMIKAGVGVTRYNEVYGVLAALPIFLFWLQASWMIMLFGAEIAFAVQNVDTYKHEQAAASASAETRLTLAFAVMQNILDGFHGKAPLFNVETYSTQLRIPVRLINNVIHVLSEAGFITASADHPQCYTLLKDPELINPKEVYDVIMREGAMPSELGLRQLPAPVEELIKDIEVALTERLGRSSLKR
jgi:membrane protein